MANKMRKLAQWLTEAMVLISTLRNMAALVYAVLVTIALIMGLGVFVTALVQGSMTAADFVAGLNDYFIQWLRLIAVT